MNDRSFPNTLVTVVLIRQVPLPMYLCRPPLVLVNGFARKMLLFQSHMMYLKKEFVLPCIAMRMPIQAQRLYVPFSCSRPSRFQMFDGVSSLPSSAFSRSAVRFFFCRSASRARLRMRASVSSLVTRFTSLTSSRIFLLVARISRFVSRSSRTCAGVIMLCFFYY